MVTVSAIAVGFLATAKAILVSLDNRRIIAEIRDSGLYDKVISYLLNSVHVSFFLSLLSAVGLLLDWQRPQPWYGVAFIL